MVYQNSLNGKGEKFLIGIIISILYFLVIAMLNKHLIKKRKNSNIVIISLIVASIGIGCVLVKYLSGNNTDEIIECIFFAITFVLVDKIKFKKF